MATRKKSTKAKRTAGGKAKPTKKRPQKRSAPKKAAKRKAAPKKAVAKNKGLKKKAGKKTASATNKTRRRNLGRSALTFSQDTPGSRSGEQSGDLQGLSNIESADSESVDELVEEGNAFEAGVVTGVEEAERRSERGVRTREVPEDDVPGEYLDQD